jgi:uncharacterized damage-inducible protein DinB
MIDTVRRLWAHCEWADGLLLDALRNAPDADSAWKEYAHILGSEDRWLSRIRGSAPQTEIWPNVDKVEIEPLRSDIVGGYTTYLHGIDEADLSRSVEYTNSAGRKFETMCGDILLHVFLHGQYHRGKINVLLRQSGNEPAPVDFIAFVRGVPAATVSQSLR